MKVFSVEHAHSIEGAEDDVFETKVIGIFSSESKAIEVVHTVNGLSGFADYPNDFMVDDYELDVIEWDGGFLKGE